MIANRTNSIIQVFAPLVFLAALLATSSSPVEKAHAQAGQKPILISQETSTRAIALESVTQQHEPFSVASPLNFSPDNRTRIRLFAMNLTLAAGEDFSAITAEAEDGGHHFYSLTVEDVRPV